MRIVVPGATSLTAQRYVIAAACGAAVAFFSLAGGYTSGQMITIWVIGVAIGMMLCIFAGIALVAGAYRRSKQVQEMGASDRFSTAAKQRQQLTAMGALFMFACMLTQWPHAFFGAPSFAGQWAIGTLGVLIGLMMQFYSEARYLKALG